MKRYVTASTSKEWEWQQHLPEAVYDRLCYCKSTKKDIGILARAFYHYSSKVQEKGWTKEDCLNHILEWVLDWNGATWDYTEDEYDDWLAEVY